MYELKHMISAWNSDSIKLQAYWLKTFLVDLSFMVMWWTERFADDEAQKCWWPECKSPEECPVLKAHRDAAELKVWLVTEHLNKDGVKGKPKQFSDTNLKPLGHHAEPRVNGRRHSREAARRALW